MNCKHRDVYCVILILVLVRIHFLVDEAETKDMDNF